MKRATQDDVKWALANSRYDLGWHKSHGFRISIDTSQKTVVMSEYREINLDMGIDEDALMFCRKVGENKLLCRVQTKSESY